MMHDLFKKLRWLRVLTFELIYLIKYLILDLKKVPNLVWPLDIVVEVSKSAMVDENMMAKWVERVLQPDLEDEPGLLIFDSFKAHLTDFVSIELENLKVDTAPIPGGYTSCLQPLDVSINSPAKKRYNELWAVFMASQCSCGEIGCEHMFTPAGHRKKPYYDQRARMVSDAMKHISVQAVKNSFFNMQSKFPRRWKYRLRL